MSEPAMRGGGEVVGLPIRFTKMHKNGHSKKTAKSKKKTILHILVLKNAILGSFGPMQWPLPPLITGPNTYPLPSVYFNENLLVYPTWDKFKVPLLCHARVTILVHFGIPHGRPHHPSTPIMTDSNSVPPKVSI